MMVYFVYVQTELMYFICFRLLSDVESIVETVRLPRVFGGVPFYTQKLGSEQESEVTVPRWSCR